MAEQVVLVNGLPGSGKTTLAGPLANRLDAPLLTKDSVKEAIADVVDPDVGSLTGPAAMEAVWVLAAARLRRVVVESWWFRPRDLEHVRRGLDTAGATSVVEVWCDGEPALARRRFELRAAGRHPVHDDGRDMHAEWAAWSARGTPLRVGPVVRADTSQAGDVETHAAQLAQRIVTILTPRRRA